MRTIISGVLVIIASVCEAQDLEVAYKSYGDGYSICVVKPTVDNFVTLVNLDYNSFVTTMKRYGYFQQEGQGGNYLSYWNGSIDNYAYAHVCNTYAKSLIRNEVRVFIPYEQVYPEDAISELYISLKPYLKQTIDIGNKYSFRYSGQAYDVYITKQSSMYDIQIIKQ